MRLKNRDRTWAKLDPAVFAILGDIAIDTVDARLCDREDAVHAIVVAHNERDLFRWAKTTAWKA